MPRYAKKKSTKKTARKSVKSNGRRSNSKRYVRKQPGRRHVDPPAARIARARAAPKLFHMAPAQAFPRGSGAASAWAAALVNPFNPKLLDHGVRIPDGNGTNTFCMQQTAYLDMPIMAVGTNPNYWITRGFAMRPSACDGTYAPPWTTNPAFPVVGGNYLQCDAFLPAYVQSGGSGVPVWSYYTGMGASDNGGTSYTTVSNYLWDDHAQQSPTVYPVGALQWTAGANKVMSANASRVRPTAWGFRIRYTGITDPGTLNVDPTGYIDFGVRLSEENNTHGGMFAAGTMVSRLRQNIDGYDEWFFDGGGPGTPIDAGQLAMAQTMRQSGRITLAQLRAMPDGLIVATGPTTADEQKFQDVDFYNGLQRIYDKPASPLPDQCLNASYTPVMFDLPGAQPWFLISGCFGAQVSVEAICHWECIPTSGSYGELPSDCMKTVGINPTALNAGSKIVKEMNKNPEAAAAVRSTVERGPTTTGPQPGGSGWLDRAGRAYRELRRRGYTPAAVDAAVDLGQALGDGVLALTDMSPAPQWPLLMDGRA